MRRLLALAELNRRFNGRDRSADISGTVAEILPHAITIRGLSKWASLGDLVAIEAANGPVVAEVLRVGGDRTVVVPHQQGGSIAIGAEGRLAGRLSLRPHDAWRGRTLDPLGAPLDGRGALPEGSKEVGLDREPPAALDRHRVERPIRTGVKAIDLFTPICAGQRLGIFAGSGVGKSTLLSMLAALPDVDTVVMALVGERGREVREFLEDTLGAVRDRVVAVVATGNDSPMLRRLAPLTAMAIAEHFREGGQHVLVIVDSLTRFAHAQREFALASGEAPVARGYPPSVFQSMAKLLERGGPGTAGQGAITLVTSVLVDGDDHNDPVADAARGILDGHIILDRRIAAQGRWPAMDLLGSISRLATKAWTNEQRELVQQARALVARFEETRDLRLIGGYQTGQDPYLDQAVALAPQIYNLTAQSVATADCFDCYAALAAILPNPASKATSEVRTPNV